MVAQLLFAIETAPIGERSTATGDTRVREDLPEARPILAEMDAIVALGVARQAAMSEGEVKWLTHPFEMLTVEEKTRLHELKLSIRPKSREEARADIIAKRAARRAFLAAGNG